ncbi:MAG: transglutaminase domain-containing protein, partial [Planctomycetaceae bacterium]
MRILLIHILSLLVVISGATGLVAEDDLEPQLKAAGSNRAEIEKALATSDEQYRTSIQFLVANMPERDLQTLSADFLLTNTRLAYEAWQSAAWAASVPEPVFLNDILPYASINERRDNWRADFRKRFAKHVTNAKSTSEAAAILNRTMFQEVGVKYSTQRKKADQSPYESIEGGTASCTGLSVLLIDACRAVGIPARMVGTPLWTNKSGNHSWVEIWDDGWRFTGACEPTGNELDKGWFVGRAATAQRDNPLHAIYATSFRRTSLSFPCVWNPAIQYISAVNVTDRYIALRQKPASDKAVAELREFLKTTRRDAGSAIEKQPFATVPLTKSDAQTARTLLSADRTARLRDERAAEMKAGMLTQGQFKMPFYYKSFGEQPADGWSMYISLHGGGGGTSRMNTGQWENQKRLYKLKEGLYVVPRAPTNTWNLWHQGHIDPLFERLLQNFAAIKGVNFNRVYVMGYSAGGDGVYQLAPRMADRWAAAAMMAGHPNETSPLGLRNLPFALQVGGKDAAYKRNEVAARWEKKLDTLRKADEQGYEHFVRIYPDKGHWMGLKDAVAIPWMAKYTRNPTPSRIVWKQDDVTHAQFYWLAVDKPQARSLIVAEIDGQTIQVQSEDIDSVTVYLDDRMLDLDSPVTIQSSGHTLYEGKVTRTIASLARTLKERGDPNYSFAGHVQVKMPAPFPASFVPADRIPRYTARRCQKPPTIDGALDDAAWKSASRTSPFVDLISGKKAMHDTRSAIVWDDDNLYVAFWVTEPNVEAKYLNRDDPIYYDNDVEIFIAGKDAYYEFEINPHGTVYEGFFIWEDAYERGGYSTDPQLTRSLPKVQPFNGVGFKNHPRGKRIAFLGYDFPNFRSAVAINGSLNDKSDQDQGWTVELAFPWSEMKWLAKGDDRSLPPANGDEWRIDLFRFNTYKAPPPAVDSGGWALGKHGVWDSHIPEI